MMNEAVFLAGMSLVVSMAAIAVLGLVGGVLLTFLDGKMGKHRGH